MPIYYYGRLHHSMALDINSNSDTIHVGGIDERVSTILSLCREREVQVVYTMSRRRLAAVLRKKFKMGCVGIFSYDGAEVKNCGKHTCNIDTGIYMYIHL